MPKILSPPPILVYLRDDRGEVPSRRERKVQVEQQLERMGLSLPQAPKPVASYVPAIQTGSLVFTSGQIPTRDGILQYVGRVGEDLSVEEAYEAARLAALNALAAVRTVVPYLDRIQRVVRLTGYVNSGPGFTGQPAVINGASDFLLELFGEAGAHSRAAVGVYALPLGAAVEIDMIVEVAG